MRKRGLLGLVLLLSSLFVWVSGASSEVSLKRALLSPAFLAYRESLKRDAAAPQMRGAAQAERRGGLIPSPVDLSHLRNADYSAYFDASPRREGFPVSYDLRNADGRNCVTPVKDQGIYGTCWAYAAMASLESIYLKRTGTALNLSEMHLAYFTYADPAGFIPKSRDFPAMLHSGGSFGATVAMLAGWRGAVPETDLPYDDSAAPAGAAADYPDRLHLQHAYYMSMTDEPTDDVRKELIMTHGAIATIFDAGDHNVNNATAAWYNHADLSPEDDPDTTDLYHPDHWVVIAGWDDGYPAKNFNEGMRPSRDGAWLIKNSWGVEHGEGGYYWVSYEDESLEDGIALIAEDASNYDNIYDYDRLGWCESFSVGDGDEAAAAWTANVFTARGHEDLRALSFYTTDSNAAYEISVHTRPVSGNPASGTRVSAQSGTQTFAGYHTVELETPVSLVPGTVFSVVMKVTNPAYGYPIAVEARVRNYSENAEANPGESFVSVDGAEWDDLGDGPEGERANVCLKAFTVDAPQQTQPASSGGGCDAGAGAGMLLAVCLLTASRRVLKIFTL